MKKMVVGSGGVFGFRQTIWKADILEQVMEKSSIN